MRYSDLMLRAKQELPREEWPLWDEFVRVFENKARFPINRRRSDWRSIDLCQDLAVEVYWAIWKALRDTCWAIDRSGYRWSYLHWKILPPYGDERLELMKNISAVLHILLRKNYYLDFAGIAEDRQKEEDARRHKPRKKRSKSRS